MRRKPDVTPTLPPTVDDPVNTCGRSADELENRLLAVFAKVNAALEKVDCEEARDWLLDIRNATTGRRL